LVLSINFHVKFRFSKKKVTLVDGILNLPENLSQNHYIEVVMVYKQVVQTSPHDNINFIHNLPNDNDGIYQAASNLPTEWLTIVHWGETKTWYDAERFEAAIKCKAPDLFEAHPDLLFQLITLMNQEHRKLPIFSHNKLLITITQQSQSIKTAMW
jgi:hypothetical protein